MAIGKRKILSDSNEFPKYEILDESKDNLKKESSFFTSLETVLDPVQKKRNEKIWKQTMGYYLLHPEKFKYGFHDL